jgi:hypothetical protein
VVIVGTSPISLIEACFLKKIENKTVLNIDERSVAGGAWTTVKHKGFPEVEAGCHIWSYEKSTYQLIRKLLNIKLTSLAPQPTIAYKRWLIPYDYKANVLSAQKIIKGVKNIKTTIQAPDVRFSLVPSNYLYPIRGAADLKKSVYQLIDQNKLELKLDTVIKTVKITKDAVCLFDQQGKALCESDELVLTSLSNIASFQFEDGKEVLPMTRKVAYIHVHFILKGVQGKAFSYIRTNGDQVIHRLSDMTSQVHEELNEHEKLFCAGIFAEAYNKMSLEAIETYLLAYLKKYKLIADTTKIIKIASSVYPSYYNNVETMKEIERLAEGKIRFLRSTDFVYSFYNQRDRYKQLLSGNSK